MSEAFQFLALQRFNQTLGHVALEFGAHTRHHTQHFQPAAEFFGLNVLRGEIQKVIETMSADRPVSLHDRDAGEPAGSVDQAPPSRQVAERST